MPRTSWHFPGDKKETAINIGYACALLEKNMEVLVVSANTAANTALQLQAAKFTLEQQKSVFSSSPFFARLSLFPFLS